MTVLCTVALGCVVFYWGLKNDDRWYGKVITAPLILAPFVLIGGLIVIALYYLIISHS